jgi:hypothetical protein
MSSTWAGDFSCKQCGAKRLTASSFSNKQLQQANGVTKELVCKACIESSSQSERSVAKKGPAQEILQCTGCKQSKTGNQYSATQFRKKGRCLDCVEAAVAAEAASAAAGRADKLTAARTATTAASKKRGAAASLSTLQAYAAEAAAEANAVTGMGPLKGAGKGPARSRTSGV